MQCAQHVLDGRHAVDQPRVLVALDDLLFIIRADQIAHHRAHHIVQRDDADHEAVFVHDHRKVFVHLAELLKHLGERQPVRHDQHLVHQVFVLERQGLIVEHALEQVLGIDIADDMVDVAVAHGVGRKRLLGDARADHFVRVVVQKEGDALALRHGRADGARIQLEHVGDHLLLAHRQHACAGAGFGHRQNVFGSDAFVARGLYAQQLEDQIGGLRVQPDDGLEDAHAPGHRREHAHGPAFGLGHAKALGEQVREQNEQRRDDEERAQKADCLRRRFLHPEREQATERGAQGTFADDTAQNRHRVLADLHDGEVVARRFLKFEHPIRAHVSIHRQLAQPQAAGRGQREFGQREKRTEHDQKGDDEEAFGQLHVAGDRR